MPIRSQLYIKQAWKNYKPDADRARSGEQNLWDAPNFSGENILLCKTEKKDLQVCSWIGKTTKKLQ